MRDETMKILKMVEDKKISAEEAAKLLEALERSSGKEETSQEKYRKTLRIKVFEGDLSKPKVNVNIPLTIVKFIGKLMPDKVKTKLDEYNVSFEQIMEMVEKGETGKLVEVEDTEENERVEIYIE
ncbi:MAG: hypothetical protein A2W07_01235 [candidate division Zixibacteria bacterium RBG_16_43_9]|nr:MAG: hypothetical protein A2W07_01235 [candidate division Zixibacteria bacterium RBG_16_43_9]